MKKEIVVFFVLFMIISFVYPVCAAENFTHIISNSEDWKEKSKNAYLYAKNNHDIREVKKQWDLIIQSVL